MGAASIKVQGAQSGAIPENAEYPTPPRLSLIEGEVTFLRQGADQWVNAQINTPLAPNDELYTGSAARLEFQIGPYAFLRAGQQTLINLEKHDQDVMEFGVASGRVVLDLRIMMDTVASIVVNTPDASFIVENAGYFRIDINEGHTRFINRSNGRARAVLTGGDSLIISNGEAVTIYGQPESRIASAAAPPPDSWDKWNLGRTDDQLKAESSQYVSASAYGLKDLDDYGTWRITREYGPVWVPEAVDSGWTPYSTGSWVRDPRYDWTWVDTAPWGWAPYHYGRWVFVNSSWCWTPGPMVPRVVYAPALVAFYGQPGAKVSFRAGSSMVGWIPLGWGEPLIPWWGRAGFIHRPWWGGWGGPRIINNVYVRHGGPIKVNRINTYRNTRIPGAMITINRQYFGHGPVNRAAIRRDLPGFRPIHRPPRLSPRPVHFVPSPVGSFRPPEHRSNRPVVRGRWDYGPASSRPGPGRFIDRPSRIPSGPPPAARAPARDRPLPRAGPPAQVRRAPAARPVPRVQPVPRDGFGSRPDSGPQGRRDQEVRPSGRVSPGYGYRPPAQSAAPARGRAPREITKPDSGQQPGSRGYSGRRPADEESGSMRRPGSVPGHRPAINQGSRPYPRPRQPGGSIGPGKFN